uniref:uncharacterized protein LOC110597050 n=1 Tax=Ictidomys tridecemlineatus TaxID=43179 RepID=UPI001A9E811F|nr:uncharacterized protein LOC110597050 [Ictidomys tridecemlineatus]
MTSCPHFCCLLVTHFSVGTLGTTRGPPWRAPSTREGAVPQQGHLTGAGAGHRVSPHFPQPGQHPRPGLACLRVCPLVGLARATDFSVSQRKSPESTLCTYPGKASSQRHLVAGGSRCRAGGIGLLPGLCRPAAAGRSPPAQIPSGLPPTSLQDLGFTSHTSCKKALLMSLSSASGSKAALAGGVGQDQRGSSPHSQAGPEPDPSHRGEASGRVRPLPWAGWGGACTPGFHLTLSCSQFLRLSKGRLYHKSDFIRNHLPACSRSSVVSGRGSSQCGLLQAQLTAPCVLKGPSWPFPGPQGLGLHSSQPQAPASHLEQAWGQSERRVGGLPRPAGPRRFHLSLVSAGHVSCTSSSSGSFRCAQQAPLGFPPAWQKGRVPSPGAWREHRPHCPWPPTPHVA